MTTRKAVMDRTTRETRIRAELTLDGEGKATVHTGLGFLDHLFTSLAKHARFDLTLTCEGDLVVDDHHTAEDCALVVGSALDAALGDRLGITRFGAAYAPMDEALARACVDLSGRAHAEIQLMLMREKIGDVACENIPHLLASFAQASRSTVHVDVLRGANDHHRAEAAFKALALALREAVAVTGSEIPSTKGVL